MKRVGRSLMVISALAVALSVPAPGTASPSVNHPSGIEILPPLHYVPPLEETLATALDDANTLARANPDAFGYPYADRATGEVVLTVRDGAAEPVARTWSPRAEAAGAPRRVQRVERSITELLRIRREVTGTGSRFLPDYATVQGVASDPEGNRTIIIVNQLSDQLLTALAGRYGTSAVAVRLDPAFGPFRNIGRHSDTAPFWGGARTNNQDQSIEGQCTTAFAWQWSGSSYMVTAGHCAHSGGDMYAPGASGQFTTYMGYVSAGTRENWRTGYGSEYVTGQQNYVEGDMALIPVSSSSAVMYRGQLTPVTYASVREMWWRRAGTGDQYCTGGATTYEMCGWGVTYSDIDTNHGGGAWALHMVVGTKLGTCATGGDSGGPTYTVRPDGGIAAKGVLSGAFGSGTSGDPCTVDFTNIHQAQSLWPGSSLKVQ